MRFGHVANGKDKEVFGESGGADDEPFSGVLGSFHADVFLFFSVAKLPPFSEVKFFL